ncbi:hypothetical protein [Bdellovibrio sp. HCB209]|uniref:hypothetical protein n=1 Tax=Bdellovibrio sp. HCB209 TaxID=3394354 RepID=UPI0039B3F67D
MSENNNQAVDYGLILLALPVIAILAVFFWIGQMNLLEQPSTALIQLYFALAISSGILFFVEAKQKDPQGAARWFLYSILFWPIAFPAYMIKRKVMGFKPYPISIVAVAGYLTITFVVAHMIDTRIAEITSGLQDFKKSMDEIKLESQGPVNPNSFRVEVKLPNFETYFSTFANSPIDFTRIKFLKIRNLQPDDSTFTKYPAEWEVGCKNGTGYQCRFRAYHAYFSDDSKSEEIYLKSGCELGDMMACSGLYARKESSTELKSMAWDRLGKECDSGKPLPCALIANNSTLAEVKIKYYKKSCELGEVDTCADYGRTLIELGRNKEAQAVLKNGCDKGSATVCEEYASVIEKSHPKESRRLRKIACDKGNLVSCTQNVGDEGLSLADQYLVMSKLCSNLEPAACYGMGTGIAALNEPSYEGTIFNLNNMACRMGVDLACKAAKVSPPKHIE